MTDRIYVWWTDIADVVRSRIDLLSDEERLRHDRYLRADDADRFLIGACVSRIVVGHRLGIPPAAVALDRHCRYCGGPHGRVRVAGANLHLSITHSGRVVGVAVSAAGPIGLDVEHDMRSSSYEYLAEQVLSPLERRTLCQLNRPDRPLGFLRYWVRKEAITKATGIGIACDLSKIVVSGPRAEPALLSWKARPASAHSTTIYDLLPRSDHPAALATLSGARSTISQLDGNHLLRGRSAATSPAWIGDGSR